MILRSFERFSETAVFKDGMISQVKSTEPVAAGKYSIDKAGRLYALYRRGNQFVFLSPTGEIFLREGTRLLSLRGDATLFCLRREGKNLCQFRYESDATQRQDLEDLTPFVEHQDLYFPEFLKALLADEGKREVLLQEWADADLQE